MSEGASSPHSHLPYGEDGSGFYSDNTIGCYNVVRNSQAMVEKALDRVHLAEGAFVICDYGTADGGTSMLLLRDCVDILKKKYGADQEIHIMYEDQPVNDFKSLFMRLQGLITGPPSYYTDFPGVFVSAVGTGFYSQCVPSNTVHLGYSATAFHWLSKRPCNFSKICHHTSGPTEEEQAMFSKQAAADWSTILVHRAREMKQGGQFVMACFGRDKEGQFMGCTKNAKVSVYGMLTELWRQMSEEGKITKEEYVNTTFNNYFRTEEEFRAPFNDPQSAVSKEGLTLVNIEFKETKCPYQEKWLAEGKKGDAEAARRHAQWYLPTCRTWSNHTFVSGLDDSRTAQEKTRLVDEMFQRYEDLVTANPDDHALHYMHAFIHLEKSK